ncbi:MAG: hypothetical protein HYR88_00155 [Verrucomicrobia bacterium]|nr:hypothetical protein [Verrucomicrobiota bacterium]MBI3868296.1 hypothetical protein [Verrucomicrobiota bacterium]
MNAPRNSTETSTSSQSSFIRSLYAPDLEAMLRAPMADLLWGTVEIDAVADAIDRVEALLHHIELRQRVVAHRAQPYLHEHHQAA